MLLCSKVPFDIFLHLHPVSNVVPYTLLTAIVVETQWHTISAYVDDTMFFLTKPEHFINRVLDIIKALHWFSGYKSNNSVRGYSLICLALLIFLLFVLLFPGQEDCARMF